MTAAPATLEEVLAVLRARRDEMRERFRVDVIGVVGSLARGEARPDSDVDVLVRYRPGASLFRSARVELELEAVLRRPVELVDQARVGGPLRAEFERDLVPA